MSRAERRPEPWPLPLGLPGLRVTEDLAYSRTEVYCTDCDWTQSGPPGFHVIRARSIRHHLAHHPGHTIEAKVRGIERFTLATAAGAATPSPASSAAGSRPTAGSPAPRGWVVKAGAEAPAVGLLPRSGGKGVSIASRWSRGRGPVGRLTLEPK